MATTTTITTPVNTTTIAVIYIRPDNYWRPYKYWRWNNYYPWRYDYNRWLNRIPVLIIAVSVWIRLSISVRISLTGAVIVPIWIIWIWIIRTIPVAVWVRLIIAIAVWISLARAVNLSETNGSHTQQKASQNSTPFYRFHFRSGFTLDLFVRLNRARFV
ncbi:hypothetical protein BH09BAC4_BH09BAC4_05790 [soil metagenome]